MQARERRRIITIAAGVVGLCVLIIIALAAPVVYRAGLRSRAIGPNAMIPLPAGTAQLGAADADLRAGERVARQVQLVAFAMHQHEVTNAELLLCVAAQACRLWRPKQLAVIRAAGARLPVAGADAFQAAEYCQWIDATLPSDDQWERAAPCLSSAIL